MPTDKPLEGLKVADFSWVLAGPSVGRVLADYGATVVHVESRRRVDLARSLSPFVNGEMTLETSAFAGDVNAGKLGLALDLSVPAAQPVAAALVDWADVVVESFTPGTMRKWGLDYAAVSSRRSDLVMVSTCLMGNAGPLAPLAGYGSGGSALGGIHYVTGWPDKPPTGFTGPYTDMVAPRFALIALLAALERRRRTGEGAYIDISQAAAGLQFMGLEFAQFATHGHVAERAGNTDPILFPNDTYPCADAVGDKSARYIAISVRSDEEWRALHEFLALEGVDDLKQASLKARFAAAERIDEAIAAATARLSAAEVQARLQARSIAAHIVLTGDDLPVDPQLVARDQFIPVDHPRRGRSYVESTRIRLSRTPGRPERAGPDIGEHEEPILIDLLGFSPAAVSALRASGALQ